MRSRNTPLSLIAFWLALFCVAGFTTLSQVSCGGGHNDAAPTTDTAAHGRATFTVRWPQPSRLIPRAANSLVVRIQRGATLLGSQTLTRPPSGDSTTASFDNLPIGALTASATAYPATDGTGTVQATTVAALTITDGTTIPLSLTMDSTITHVLVVPRAATLGVGDSFTPTATAYDKDNQAVLTAPDSMSWSSSDSTVLRVDSAGQITAVGAGTATITAQETESGKSGGATVTVNSVSPSPSPSGPGTTEPQFAVGVRYDTEGAGDQVIAGDFDGDSNPDVAIGTWVGLRILYGRGDGTLEAPVTIDFGTHFGARCASDINNDGKLDLIACDSNGTYLFLNNGGRSFAAPIILNTGFTICATAGQTDGTGNKEIAVVVQYPDLSGHVFVLRLEDGALHQIGTYDTPMLPLSVTMGDLNQDGKTDLIISFLTSTVYQSGFLTRFGNGDGTFSGGDRYNTGTQHVGVVAIADLNNDGKPDIAANDYWDANVAILLNTGGGTLGTPSYYLANGYPTYPYPADFDGDGFFDLALANAGSDKVTVLWNRGNGRFADGKTYPVNGENCRSMDVADFNKDGKPDIVVQSENTKSVSVLLNTTP